MKKITKRLAAILACAVMTASSAISAVANAATDDHGNTMSTATSFTNGVTGTIDYSGDVDYFKYTATSDGIKYFYINNNSSSVIYILNSSGSQIATSTENECSGHHLTGVNASSGSTYYIVVRSNGSGYGSSYTLNMATALGVTHLFQRDPKWNNTKLNGSSSTIGDAGCALTSFAMIASYMENASYTPLSFNNSTYVSNGNMTWKATGYTVDRTTSQEDALSALASGKPIMIRITRNDGGTHFVVATGYNGSTFYMKDAGTSDSSTLSLSTKYPNCTISEYIIYSR